MPSSQSGTMSPRSDRAEFFEFALEHPANFSESRGALRLEAQNQRRLSIGRPYQAPPVLEIHAHAIDVDHIVMLAKIVGRSPHHLELPIIGAIEPNLRRERALGKIGENSAQSARFLAHDLEQAERCVDGV